MGTALFHPTIVLAISSSITLIFVALMTLMPRFAGEGQFYSFFYHAPIVFAFVVYLFDRVQHWDTMHLRQWFVELVVIGLALARTVLPVPFISGHALFLTYVLLTGPRRLAWWIAALVLVDVCYIKIVILHDATLLGGAVAGLLAALAVKWDIWRDNRCKELLSFAARLIMRMMIGFVF